MAKNSDKSKLRVAEDGNLEEAGSTKPEKKDKKKQPASVLSFSKVKLVKNTFLTIVYSRIEKDGSTTAITENHKAPVHEDLKKKFEGMGIHLALLCDYLSTRQIKDISAYDPELVETFHVSSVSIGGNDDDEGIVLTGHKITKRKVAVILNSPFARIEEVEETKYRYMDDLKSKVDSLLEEVKLYLGGKRGPDPQQSLEFPEDELPEE